jgi:AcrR family transcriptional regulator
MPRIKEATLEEHRRNTMNALLDSAETIMREQGSDALTPAAVSRGAGIARNSIYRYVRDMQDLRRGLMNRHLPDWLDALSEALSTLDDPADVIATWVRVNLEQSVIHGHEWLTHLPTDDAEKQTRRHRKNGESSQERQDNADDDPTFSVPYVDPYCGKPLATHSLRSHNDATGEQPSNAGQPSLHERVNAPIEHAWEQLRPSDPKVGVALTTSMVSSGMRLLSECTQAKEKQQTTITDIVRATRALVVALSE